MLRALITGLAGTTLADGEAAFLRRERPCGIILFARNCTSPDQVKALVLDATAAVGVAELLVLVDQEGGRVQRLKPPHWRPLPPAAAYAELYRRSPAKALEAAWLAARLTAHDLRSVGINTNCAPVADVPTRDAHDIIGNRAYGDAPDMIAALGRAVADGLLAGGVLPVMKHIPGHGRAMADSHFDLPVVTAPRQDLAKSDFAAFRALRDLPAAMTAHVVYASIDPHHPASISPAVTRDVIRDDIGFDGLLMSDDICMKALTGDMAARATAVLAAGSDIVLHCSGDLAEMTAVAAATSALAGESLSRWQRCAALLDRNEPFDRMAAAAAISEALAVSA